MRVVPLLTFAALLPAASLADCETDAPAAARQFWQSHSHFYQRPDSSLRDLTTPRFYAALEREWACIAKNPPCAAYEPWPHPGDTSLAGHPTFYVSLDQPDHVLVSMNYAVHGAYGRAGPQQFVIMTLTQGPKGRCWLLDDLVTAQQGSFREQFQRPDSQSDHTKGNPDVSFADSRHTHYLARVSLGWLCICATRSWHARCRRRRRAEGCRSVLTGSRRRWISLHSRSNPA